MVGRCKGMDRAELKLDVEAVASRHTRGLIDNFSFGAPVWPVTK